MESSRSKVELVKPVFLMAGIPLAFSLAVLILAKITSRKSPFSKPSPPDVNPVNSMERSSPENDFHEVHEDEGSFCGHDLTTFLSLEDGNTLTNTQMRNSREEEILGLRSMIKELQEREWEVEAQFLRYQDLKEQEFVVNEFQNHLLLELARIEFMDREVSSMEAENQKFNNMVIDYLRTLEELESSKLENDMLQRKVKKLLKRIKERSRVIGEQNLLIEAKEAVISRNGMGLETEANTIKGLKDEIEELQTAIRRLQEEKSELLKKLEMAENSASLKNEAERESTMNDYNHQVVNELEQLQKDRAVEVKELINLRWRNACLRHKLLKRSNQEQYEDLGLKNNESSINVDFGGSAEMGRFSLESGSNSSILTQSESSLAFNKGDRGHSKSRSLYGKLKKWMDASEKVKKHKSEEKKKPELKFFGSHSVTDLGEETQYFPTRKPSTDNN